MSVILMLTGAVTHNSATVTVQSDATPPESVRLKVSTNSDMSSPSYSGSVNTDADGYAKVALSGLSRGTRYYVQPEVGGVVDTAWTASFTTFRAAAGQPLSGKVLTSSCDGTAGGSSGTSAYQRMASHSDSLLFFHTGDQNYADISGTSAAAYQQAQRLSWMGSAGSAQRAFWLNNPVDYMWDDHDFGANDSDRTSPGRDTVAGVYRQTFPHYPLVNPSSGSIEHVVNVGRVRFIVTDLRYHRDPTGQALPRTMMGATQLAWFKDQVLQAHNDPTVMQTFWVASQAPMTPTYPGSWSYYAAERTDIWDFLATNEIGTRGEFAVIGGDIHACALLRRTDYSTLGNCAPIRQMTASPIYQSQEYNGYGLEFDNYTGDFNMFGVITFADHGDSMDVTYEAHQAFDGKDIVRWSESWTVEAA